MNPIKYFTLSLIIFSFNTAQAAKPETAGSPPAKAKQMQPAELKEAKKQTQAAEQKVEEKIKETTEVTAEKKQSEAKKKMSDASDKTDAVRKEAGKVPNRASNNVKPTAANGGNSGISPKQRSNTGSIEV